MKRVYWCILFVIAGMELCAQQDYFVFIHQPAGQPFYVRMGEDSYSSSAAGHLILSPMQDSVYSINIGFPRSKYPEQLFRITVNRKDKGYELKNIDGRWQLYDLETQLLMRPVNTKKEGNMVKRTDSYSALMAGVVDDSAVLYRAPEPDSAATEAMEVADQATTIDSSIQVAAREDTARNDAAMEIDVDSIGVNTAATPERENGKKTEKKGTAGAKTERKKDTAAVKTSETTPSVAEDTAKVQPVNNSDSTIRRDPRDIIRYGTENVIGGKLMIYLDRSGPVTDTIRIIVPRL